MKALILVIAALLQLIHPVFAESEIQLELQKLKLSRDAALARARKPIDDQYLKMLQSLLEKATKQNDLEVVIQISTELKALKEPEDTKNEEDDTKKTEGESPLNLSGTQWTWERPGVVESLHFMEGGIFAHTGFKGTWSVTGERTVALRFVGRECIIEFNKGANSFKAVTEPDKSQGLHGKKKKG